MTDVKYVKQSYSTVEYSPFTKFEKCLLMYSRNSKSCYSLEVKVPLQDIWCLDPEDIRGQKVIVVPSGKMYENSCIG